jgi:hypothetical protein
MVWFLLGLLFISVGLYLGFESSMTFTFLMIGFFSCVFGLVLFGLQLQERPKKSAATRLSPNFISAGSTVAMPAMSNVENEHTTERSAAE